MAVTTTYTCDRCKVAAVDDPRFLTVVRIQTENNYNPRFSEGPQPHKSWCDDCLIATGIIHPGNKGKPASQAPNPPPTLEDVVRQIVQEEIQAAGIGQ